MKKLLTLLLFLLTLFVPCVILFLIFSDAILYSATLIFCLSWGLVYIYIDKFLLFALGAREVFETDEHMLFQSIKNESYKQKVRIPRVYVYTGEGNHSFILESRNSWSIVIDRKLVNSLSDEQVASIVEFYYHFLTENKCSLYTKTLGVCSFAYQGIFTVLGNFFFLKRGKIPFKTLSTFLILLLRPFLIVFEYISLRQKKIFIDDCLNGITQRENNSDIELSLRIFFNQFNSDLTVKKILIKYLEGFSLLNFMVSNER